jgi:hypothetical protein
MYYGVHVHYRYFCHTGFSETSYVDMYIVQLKCPRTAA